MRKDLTSLAIESLDSSAAKWWDWKLTFLASLSCVYGRDLRPILQSSLFSKSLAPTPLEFAQLLTLLYSKFSKVLPSNLRKQVNICKGLTMADLGCALDGTDLTHVPEVDRVKVISAIPTPAAIWAILLQHYEPAASARADTLLTELEEVVMLNNNFPMYRVKLEDIVSQLLPLGEVSTERSKVFHLLRGLPRQEPWISLKRDIGLRQQCGPVTFDQVVQSCTLVYTNLIYSKTQPAAAVHTVNAPTIHSPTSPAEKCKIHPNSSHTNENCFAQKRKSQGKKGGSKPKLHCSRCGEGYHDDTTCWKVHPELRKSYLDNKYHRNSGKTDTKPEMKSVDTVTVPPAVTALFAVRMLTVHDTVVGGAQSCQPSRCSDSCASTIHTSRSQGDGTGSGHDMSLQSHSEIFSQTPLSQSSYQANCLSHSRALAQSQAHGTGSGCALVHQTIVKESVCAQCLRVPLLRTAESVGGDKFMQIDSGAQVSVFADKSLFIKTRAITKGAIQLNGFDGTSVEPDLVGTVSFTCVLDGAKSPFILEDVFLVPTCETNLIAETSLIELGYRSTATPGCPCKWRLFNGNELVLQATCLNKKYIVDSPTSPGVSVRSVSMLTAWDWHTRLGHPGLERQRAILKSSDKPCDESPEALRLINQCRACQLAKSKRQPHPKKQSPRASLPLERVHVDIVGPLSIPSHDGSTYVAAFTDDYSRHVTHYYLKKKSELPDAIEDYVRFNEASLGLKVKCLHMDNAQENVSNRVREFSRERGITWELTVPYHPKSNGVVERSHQRVFTTARALLKHARMDSEWWQEAVSQAVILTNHLPTAVLKGKTPREAFTNQPSFLHKFKTFGCLAYVHSIGAKKLEDQARECVYLGVDASRAEWLFYDLRDHVLFPGRDVVFYEKIFPFAPTFKSAELETTPQLPEGEKADFIDEFDEDFDDEMEPAVPTTTTAAPTTTSAPQPTIITSTNPRTEQIVPHLPAGVLDSPSLLSDDDSDDNQNPPVRSDDEEDEKLPLLSTATAPAPIPQSTVPMQVDEPSTAPSQILLPQSVLIPVSEQKQTTVTDTSATVKGGPPVSSSSSVVKPVPDSTLPQASSQHPPSMLARLPAPFVPRKGKPVVVRQQLGANLPLTALRHSTRTRHLPIDPYMKHVGSIGIQDKNLPTNLMEALAGQEKNQWKQACEDQLNEFKTKQVYEPVPSTVLKGNEKPIGLKWVFTYKYNEVGEIIGHKARLVAQGFSQVLNRDYVETFSPVVQRASLRLMLAICAHKHFKIAQYDIKSAYLNAKLDIPQISKQAPGFEDSTGNLWRITKALYGLKQAGRQWNADLTASLLKAGYCQSLYDPCLFYQFNSKGELTSLVAIWVDDMLQGYLDDASRVSFFSSMQKQYEVKQIEEAKWILGMRLKQEKNYISLDQEQHIRTFLKNSSMDDAKPVSTPAVPTSSTSENKEATSDESLPPHLIQQYQQLVGSCLYISDCTRADLAFAVGRLCRHMSRPTANDLQQCKRVLRYLNGDPARPLIYQKSTKPEEAMVATIYTDASWADDAPTGRTTAGFASFINNGLVSWKSKLLPTIALSTCEAEYMAAASAAQEAAYLVNVCQELHLPLHQPIRLFCDNQAALDLVSNPVHHQRTKHMNARYHFIRSCVSSGIIQVLWTSTSQMIADGFTKALNAPAHLQFVRNLFEAATAASK